MNDNIINEISKMLNIKNSQTTAVLKLLEEGNTIPFIARYRKEATSNLDEEVIRQINEVYIYQVNLLKRKEDVIRLIEEKDLLTEELKKQILMCEKLVEVEDLYRPFKEKKKTKATQAIQQGLEPLAALFLKQPDTLLKDMVCPFVKEDLNFDECIQGAKYIIAEMISDNASYRKYIRQNTYIYGTITSKYKKGSLDEKKIFENYYAYEELIKQIKPHRILALNRGENLKILNVNIEVDNQIIIKYLENKLITKESSVKEIIMDSINDAYKRLIKPSIQREIRTELTAKAEDSAIDNFGKNLEKLLLTPPMKDKIVLGFDPAFRTGCKLAVMDATGKYLEVAVIYPTLPKLDIEGSKKTLISLINKYNVDIIAIGNGTASRESEQFVASVLKELNKNVQYIIVNEAGASVYSASPLAIEEFPDLTVEKRSAISIGRRLQDPLSELVKINPESIGVGLYQHDVSNKKLSESLDFVVTKAVNSVGVNINTASPSLLKYVSGLTKKNIEKIIDYRNKTGKILSRKEIKKLLSDKVFEQAIGFIRIVDGDNILDSTDIHPESYDMTMTLLNHLNLTINDIGTEKIKEALNNKEINLDIDKYTLEDIKKSLIKPNRDPRDEMEKPLLKSDVLDIKDLSLGMKLQGTVRNVVDFGAFIDIGLHNDGLAHISKLCNKFIKHPSEVVGVGDIVDCYVEDINIEKEKVSLSLIEKK